MKKYTLKSERYAAKAKEEERAPAPRRRLVLMDGVVAVAAVLALVSPFLIRSAAIHTSQAAQRGEVSPIRPIDLELGYREARDEAAFFEAQGKEPPIDISAFDAGWQDITANVLPQPMPLSTPGADLLAFTGDSGSIAFNADDLAALGGTQPEPSVAVAMIEPETAAPLPEPSVTSLAPERSPLPPVHPANRKPVPSASALRATIEEQPLAPLSADAVAPAVDPAAVIETVVVQMDAPGGPRLVSEPDMAGIGAAESAGSDAAAPDAMPGPVAALSASEAAPEPPALSTGAPARIALVITAAGLNADVTRFAIDALPEGITLAFAPVKPNVGALAEEAKADGHTVLVEIPMEPINRKRDPGAMTLRVNDPVTENLNRLEKALGRVPVASGASSYLGARFNADERAVAPIVEAVKRRGLFFFENQPIRTSVLERVAARSHLRYAKGTVVIDEDKSIRGIQAALDALERRARAGQPAIGVGTALRGTISTVELWAKEAQKRGVVFVPITEVRR